MRTTAIALAVFFALTIAGAVLFVVNGARNAAIVSEALAAIDDPQLYDLDGKWVEPWDISHDAVNVWVYTRTDCPISNRYAPEVRALCETFHSRGVNFYLIYVDPRETGDSIRAHLDEYEYPCPALRDPHHTTIHFTRVNVTPEAVVFDKSGRIAYRGRISDLFVGLGNARANATKHDLSEAIEATLNGQPVAEPMTKAVGCPIADLKK